MCHEFNEEVGRSYCIYPKAFLGGGLVGDQIMQIVERYGNPDDYPEVFDDREVDHIVQKIAKKSGLYFVKR